MWSYFSAGSQLFSEPIDRCFSQFGWTRRMLEYELDHEVFFTGGFQGQGQRLLPCRYAWVLFLLRIRDFSKQTLFFF